MSNDFDWSIFKFEPDKQTPIPPTESDRETEPEKTSPDWIAGAEVTRPGTTDRWFESLPMVRDQFAKFQNVRRLCDNGYPRHDTPKPSAEILADVGHRGPCLRCADRVFDASVAMLQFPA